MGFFPKKKSFCRTGPIYSSNSKGCHYLIKKGAKLVESAEDILEELNLPSRKRKEIIRTSTKEESLILKALSEGALNIDEIIEKTKLSVQIVNQNLIALEIKGELKNLGGNIYAINNR